MWIKDDFFRLLLEIEQNQACVLVLGSLNSNSLFHSLFKGLGLGRSWLVGEGVRDEIEADYNVNIYG